MSGGIGVAGGLEANHIGPQSRVSSLPLVPLGSDLPDQGQASDRNELCTVLYTFGTTFSDSLHISIYAT